MNLAISRLQPSDVAEVRRKRTYTAPALEKGFQILEVLATQPNGASLSEMAVLLGRSISELFRMVFVLEQLGYLHKPPHSDRYTVAYKLLDLALRATPAQHLVRAALPEMRELAEKTGQSCHFVIASCGKGLVVARAESHGIFGFALQLGAAVDMVESCSGQVILAFSKPERAERLIIEAEAIRANPANRSWLAEHLDRVREYGFSSRRSPTALGITGISFPVFEYGQEITGALTIPFLELIDGSQKVDFIAAKELLRAATQKISATFGCAPRKPIHKEQRTD